MHTTSMHTTGGGAKRRRMEGTNDPSTTDTASHNNIDTASYGLYKELASLAGSINQPSLVFWLLELCSEQSAWIAGSRAGAFRYH